MAGRKSSPIGHKKKRRKWRYFFYGDKLHKTLAVNRSSDEVYAWKYSEGKRYIYSWSDVQRSGYQALTRTQVGKIVNRAPRTISEYVYRGLIPKPERTYCLETGAPGMYMFSRKDVWNIFEVVKGMHYGRPRKDGMVKSRSVPNEQEVRAAAINNLFFYGRTDDGRYVPIWASEEY